MYINITVCNPWSTLTLRNETNLSQPLDQSSVFLWNLLSQSASPPGRPPPPGRRLVPALSELQTAVDVEVAVHVDVELAWGVQPRQASAHVDGQRDGQHHDEDEEEEEVPQRA